MNYDIVGDLHGQSQKFEALLRKLGYVAAGSGYRAPLGHQLVLLGDLIDRGPGQMRVLDIARTMVESGDALCVMGNHEFNALAYVTDDPYQPGEALRPNRNESNKCQKNRAQHAEFLAQVGEGSDAHRDWVQWFRSLPPFLELNGIRAVHGCWDQAAVDLLRESGWGAGKPLDEALLVQVANLETTVKDARKLLLCGLEIPLAEGLFIQDKAGHRHTDVRIASWRHWGKTLGDVALVPKGQEELLSKLDWPAGLVLCTIEGSPVFVGHHWFSGHPVIESPKLACLDWSSAADGPQVAYRWSGEEELSNDKLIWV
jgi:hypothetical protein